MVYGKKESLPYSSDQPEKSEEDFGYSLATILPYLSPLIKDRSEPEHAWERLPYPLIMVLQKIGILHHNEVEAPDRKPKLTYPELSHAYKAKGQIGIQEVKARYIKQLTGYLTNQGIGVPLKAWIQTLLQQPSTSSKDSLGDPSTWILDPLDTQSCLAVVKFLTENQRRRNLWIGFAMAGDWTDPNSRHKNQRPPILGRNEPIDNLDDFRHVYHQVLEVVRQERLHALSRRLALSAEPYYYELDHRTKKLIEEKQLPLAKDLLERTEETGDWDHLNQILGAQYRTPLYEDDHCLIKIFSQDDPRWQIADLMVDKDSLVIEYPNDRLTPRAAENTDGPVRIVIRRNGDDKPIVFCHPEQTAYLLPLLNDRKYLKGFDYSVKPFLPRSPYHQVQFMTRLKPTPNEAGEVDQEQMLKRGYIAFLVDVISGKHQKNTRDNFGNHNDITRYLEGMEAKRLNETAIIAPPKLIELFNQYPTHLYQLLKRTYSAKSIEPADRQEAKDLLLLFDGWQGTLHLPPRLKETLRAMAGSLLSYSVPHEVITILEQQLEI